MAQRTRKCDRPQAAKAKPPKKECCPICLLQEDRVVRDGSAMIHEFGCMFFRRCKDLKFEEDAAKSAAKRSAMFREFHADICPTCKKPKDECKAEKIARVKSRRRRNGFPYIEDGEMTDLLKKEKCHPPNQKYYTPVKPDWYLEEPKPKE